MPNMGCEGREDNPGPELGFGAGSETRSPAAQGVVLKLLILSMIVPSSDQVAQPEVGRVVQMKHFRVLQHPRAVELPFPRGCQSRSDQKSKKAPTGGHWM
jgi:hypothetical protein